MIAPLSSVLTRIWIYLACASGNSTGLAPVLANDGLGDLIYNFKQMGSSINFEVDNVGVAEGKPLGAPDIVLSAGDSPLNLFLFIAHYVCRPSRVKINGQGTLNRLDLKPLANFLPEIGCRLTSIIPKSAGLPIRLECTGVLPEKIVFPANLPKLFPLLMGVALMFYERSVIADFGSLPDRETIIKKLEYIFSAVTADFKREDFSLVIAPGNLAIPAKAALPMDGCVSSFLLALAEPLRGKVDLAGFADDSQKEFLQSLTKLGLKWQQKENEIINDNPNILNNFSFSDDALRALFPLPEYALPLLVSLAASSVLAGGTATLPLEILSDETVRDFFATLGLETDQSGNLMRIQDVQEARAWLAPDAQWAMALAMAACGNHAKRPILLANPGIMTSLWSGFWALYNGLPDPKAKAAAKTSQVKKGRRILTNIIAIPPEE